jgi:hypothetical protein
MKKASTILLVTFLMLAINFSAKAQVSGIVFRDFNGRGQIKSLATFKETVLEAIADKAFNCNNVQLDAGKTIDAFNEYSFVAVPDTNIISIKYITQ